MKLERQRPSGASGGRDRDACQRQGKLVRVCDFVRRAGIGFDSPDDRLAMEDPLIVGEFLHQELRRGLILHLSDVMEERSFTATSQVAGGLSCIFLLDGKIDLRIGDRRFALRADQGAAMNSMAIMSARAESFERVSPGRQHVCHLVVSATPEWLGLEGFAEVGAPHIGDRLFNDHLAHRHWTPTPRVVELVRQLLAPSTFMPELRNLYLEGRAVEIVAETISAVMHADRAAIDSSILTRREMARLQCAKDLIATNFTGSLTVEWIARESGISTSGLQRLFRQSEGLSVFAYVRRCRLERAYSALSDGDTSIEDASIIAGYSSPANFATAFRRRFGMTPREVLASRKKCSKGGVRQRPSPE